MAMALRISAATSAKDCVPPPFFSSTPLDDVQAKLAAHRGRNLARFEGKSCIFKGFYSGAALEPAQLAAGAGCVGAVVGIGHIGKAFALLSSA